VKWRRTSVHVARWERLDLDNIGAKIAENGGAERASKKPAQIEYANAF
jgi:hypothetical protein